MVVDVEKKTCSYCERVYSYSDDFYNGTSRWRVCDRKNLWFNCSCGSTLMLPAGKFSWYSPVKTMSVAAASVFNSLSDLATLPHVPAAVMEIQQLLQSNEVEISALAKKVKTDPVIAANLLSMANNIKANRDPHDRKKIESLEHAIVFVGKKTLSELVMTISLKMFKSNCKVFNTELFWRESFLTGDIAESLSVLLGSKCSKDELFIGASLCNIGKFVAAVCLPDTIDKIQTYVDSPKTLSTWQQAEIKLKAPEHCILGEIGAGLWGLPIYVVEASGHHHKSKAPIVGKALDGEMSMTEIIALANQLTHWVLLRPSRIDQALLDKLAVTAKVSKQQLEDFCASLAGLAKKAAS